MALARIPGKQIAQAPNGLDTANLNDSSVTAVKLGAIVGNGLTQGVGVGAPAVLANPTNATITVGVAGVSVRTDGAGGLVASANGLAVGAGDGVSVGATVAVDATVVRTAGTQTISGDKTFSANVTVPAIPTAATHATSKGYVDSVANGLDVKASVRLATAAALPANTRTANTLTASANGALTVDGVAVAANDRVLVKDEGTGANKGLYKVMATGSGVAPFVLDRAADADADAEVTSGLFTFVAEGTVNADSGWVLTTNDPITLNTTVLSFSQFSGAGQITAGAGLVKTGNTIDVVAANGSIVVNPDSIEVGYGAPSVNLSAATANSGGAAATAARSDHSHAITTGAPSALGAANAQGTAAALARADHVHVRDAHQQEYVTPTASQTAFPLAQAPVQAASLQMFLNGVLLRQGAGQDYTVSGATVTYGGSPAMQTTDLVTFCYVSQGA
jgi:hypothetical protein